MKHVDIDREVIIGRLALIEKHVARLKKMSAFTLRDMEKEDNFDIAAWNLKCALEAVFDIGAHILSKIPGQDFQTYKDIARGLGAQAIVPLAYAKDPLENMAGYRNRLTHFYAEITPKEIHVIITKHLGDFAQYMKYIKKLLGK